jgi:hypothetical protein
MAHSLYLEAVGWADERDSRFRIRRLPCVIGRGGDCDLNLAREQVSRRHARIEASQDGLIIEDLGSTNGTFVNLERISGPVPIITGDRIHFGSDEFVLSEGERSDTVDIPGKAAAATAGHTMMGFTADPTGFPVQAPQFYELLNEELIAVHAQPVVTVDGQVRALTLRAASRHPDLDAQHNELQHLAAQLGEEARLNQIIRQHGLQAADRAEMDEHPLIVLADPVEVEDPELLADELRALCNRHVRLQLAVEIPLRNVERAPLLRLLGHLEQQDIQPVLGVTDAGDAEQLELVVDHSTWLSVDGHQNLERLTALSGQLSSRLNQLIVDRVDDRHQLDHVKGLPGIWMRGRAAAETTALRAH